MARVSAKRRAFIRCVQLLHWRGVCSALFGRRMRRAARLSSASCYWLHRLSRCRFWKAVTRAVIQEDHKKLSA